MVVYAQIRVSKSLATPRAKIVEMVSVNAGIVDTLQLRDTILAVSEGFNSKPIAKYYTSQGHTIGAINGETFERFFITLCNLGAEYVYHSRIMWTLFKQLLFHVTRLMERSITAKYGTYNIHGITRDDDDGDGVVYVSTRKNIRSQKLTVHGPRVGAVHSGNGGWYAYVYSRCARRT